MPLNVGYIELGGTDVNIRVYYDTTFVPVGPDQPLIDGPRGYCLDITNRTGERQQLTISGVSANPLSVRIGTGDPVVGGQGGSRTAAQLASLGYTTRGNVGNITVE